MAAESPQFVTVIRGYDRAQVDDFAVAKRKEIARLKLELSEARRQRRLATEHAEATETELRELRTAIADTQPPANADSFGFRTERLLRMAEQEASDLRTHASREAAQLTELARVEADRHRRDTEQALAGRAARLERQAAQRTAELKDRERQLAEQLIAARERADQLHAAAVRAADRIQTESIAAAETTRQRAEADAQRCHDEAAQETARLRGLQTGIRSELDRLTQLLGDVLSTPAHAETTRHRRQARRSGTDDQHGPIPGQPDREQAASQPLAASHAGES